MSLATIYFLFEKRCYLKNNLKREGKHYESKKTHSTHPSPIHAAYDRRKGKGHPSRFNVIKEETAKVLSQTITQDGGSNENPNTIFARAISDYGAQFPSYLDVTALNVSDKTAIDLADYNPDYVAPDFSDVMYDYQVKLVKSLSIADRMNYDSLRRQNYSFDRYATLNEGKYENLNPTLKYPHAEIPMDPMTPITPEHPTFTPINSITGTQVGAIAVTGIVSILTSAGLKDAAITAFTACVSTMTTGLSTSWIPIVGWALAVALVVGALIALTVVIVKNWGIIKSAMDDIKTWFLEEFSKFASFIESFFADAAEKGRQSTISSITTIGGKTFQFQQVQVNDVSTELAMTRKMRDTQDILLMQFIKPLTFQVALTVPVDEAFCVKYKTHCLGYSSYTWFEHMARELILYAGTGYTSAKPELHLANQNQPTIPQGPSINRPKPPAFAFKHFHNFTSNGVRDEREPFHWTHSFFGPLYSWSDNGPTEVQNPIV